MKSLITQYLLIQKTLVVLFFSLCFIAQAVNSAESQSNTQMTKPKNEQTNRPVINQNQLIENQIYIQSDSMQYDDQKLISIYWGNVYAKQIARELYGDRMIVSYNGDKSVKQIEVFGKPAQYKQTKTNDQEAIEGSAKYIKYLKDEGVLELKENVYLNKTDFKSSSENLIYKIDTGEVRAESGNQKRVEMILN